MLVFDAHLDLSMNALEWNRYLTCIIPEMFSSRGYCAEDVADIVEKAAASI